MAIENRTRAAIVTGGSRGIGRAIVARLAQDGCFVAFSYNSGAEAAQQLVDQLGSDKAYAFQWSGGDDTTALESTLALLKERGTNLDVLVNNAGITRDGYFAMSGFQDFRDVVEVNLLGMAAATRAVVRTFISQKSGVVVNISSIAGVMGTEGQASYSASKAGIIAFTKSLARSLADTACVRSALRRDLSKPTCSRRFPSSSVGRWSRRFRSAGRASPRNRGRRRIPCVAGGFLRQWNHPRRRRRLVVIQAPFDRDQIAQILPHKLPFLLLDEVTHVVPGLEGHGIRRVRDGDWFFNGHFPGNPIMPGVIIVECLAQLSAVVYITEFLVEDLSACAGQVGYLAKTDVKFHAPVRPPSDLRLHAKMVRKVGSFSASRSAQVARLVSWPMGSSTCPKTKQQPVKRGTHVHRNRIQQG